MGADMAGSARVAIMPSTHTEATLVAPRVAPSAVVIRVDLAVAAVISVGTAAMVTLVVADVAAVVATTKIQPPPRNLWVEARAFFLRREEVAHPEPILYG